MSKKKKTDVIKKKENHSFTKKFNAKELEEKQKEFSILCTDAFLKENQIQNLKEEIKNGQQKLKTLAAKINEGGETTYEECDVEIVVSEMKKNYYYEGGLVDTEDAEEYDLQLEIEEE